MDKQAKFNRNSPYWYGLRYGTNTPKASGYFGEIPVSDGDVATEYSVGVNIDGKEMQIPSITPNLEKDQITNLVNALRSNSEIPDDVMYSAIEHAKQRISSGKSPFWSMPEKQYPIPSTNDYYKRNEQMLNQISNQPLGLMGIK